MNTTLERAKGRTGKALLLAALLSSGAGWAAAAAADDATSASVRFERGELASAEGIEAVHERVLRAAREACRIHGVRDVARLRLQQECRNEMTEKLLAAIDSERLRQFHAQYSGRSRGDAG